MTTTESRMPAAGPASLIEELFCQGHPLTHVVAVGEEIGWTREDVNAVLRDRQWDLDGSGRLPRSKRITAPRGLRAARPPASPAPAPSGRRVASVERPQRRVIDAAPIDEWDGPQDQAVDLVPDGDVNEQPADAPPAAQPPAVVFSAIAEWAADDDTATDPAPVPVPLEGPKAIRSRRPAGPRPTAPDPSDGIVERFLLERTVPASDDQFLTSPQLRAAFDEWRTTSDAPEVSRRRFGMAVSSRYGKRQATVHIDGIKPICYYGLAWKPAEAMAQRAELDVSVGSEPDDLVEEDDHDARHPHWVEGCAGCVERAEQREAERLTERRWLPPLDGPLLPAMTASVSVKAAATAEEIREQVDAMTSRVNPDGSVNAQHVAVEQTLRERAGLPGYIAALDGPGKFLPPAEPEQVEPTVTVDQVAEVHEELVAAAASEPERPSARVQPVDLLATGREHPDRRVRAAAAAVERAVDALCASLSRVASRG